MRPEPCSASGPAARRSWPPRKCSIALIEEGLLSLDTTVAEALPGLRLGAADLGDQVTVAHLLTHTSGLDGDIFTDTGRATTA